MMKMKKQRRIEVIEGRGECVKEYFGQGYYGKDKSLRFLSVCFIES